MRWSAGQAPAARYLELPAGHAPFLSDPQVVADTVADFVDAQVRAGPAHVDAMHVPARGFAEGTTLDQLVAFARTAETSGGWAVFLFHGIGGDQLSVDAATHRAFLAWLRQHRRTIRVATLRDALALR